MFYCMFYFTCDRSLCEGLGAGHTAGLGQRSSFSVHVGTGGPVMPNTHRRRNCRVEWRRRWRCALDLSRQMPGLTPKFVYTEASRGFPATAGLSCI